MAESITITFDGVDNTGRATSSAVANIDKLAHSAKSLNAEYVSAGTIMGKYTNAQYQSARSAEVLMNKSAVLAQAVQRGKITVDQAREAYARYEKQEQRNIWSAMSAGEKYKTVSQRLENMQAGMVKVGIAAAGVTVAGKAIYDFAKSGAELEYTRTKFDRLSGSMGTTGDIMLTRLREATRGTVSDMQLARNGADLFQLGLARTADEAVRLSKVQTALGMDTGELTLALANQSKRRLDQLGLSLTKFNEIEAKLKSSGMTKAEAFREAFLQTAEQTVLTTGNMADSNLGNFLRMQASAANVIDTLKLQAPNMGMGWMFGGDTMSQTANKVGMFMNGINQLMKGQTVFDLSGGLGAPSWVRQAKAQDLSSLWNRPTQRPAGITDSQWRAMQMSGQAYTGLSAAQNYTAMAFAYGGGAGGAGTQGPEAAPIDYAALTEGALKLTQYTTSYADKLAEINQLQKDGKINIEEQGAAMRDLEASADAQASAFALSLMQQDEAFDPERAYDFAAATGQITKEAAEQYKAFNKVKDALGSNKISAEEAAYAVKSISGDMSALDGMSVETFIDVFIRAHGDLEFSQYGMGLGPEGGTGTKKRHGGEVGFAAGTSDIGRSGIFRVGEMGEEGLVVRRDGSIGVIPSGVWKQMNKYGVGADGAFAMGTDDKGGSSLGSTVKRRATPSGVRISSSFSVPMSADSMDAVRGEMSQVSASVTQLAAVVAAMTKTTTTPSARQVVDMSRNTIHEFAREVGVEIQKAVG